MLGFFSRKTSIIGSGLLDGFVDWHSHILPGVDDGVRNMQEALDVLAEYEKAGVKAVWLTPHVMEDMPNETAELKERFAELCERYTGSIKLNLAAEYMIDNLFLKRLETDDFLTLGHDGRHLLVETSYISAPQGFDSILKRIMANGYFPVLAHPERYKYMSRDDYRRYLDMGIIFQTNLFSSLGAYGESARRSVKTLLEMEKSETGKRLDLPVTEGFETPTSPGAISLVGSDVHGLKQVMRLFPLKEFPPSVARALKGLCPSLV